MNYKSIEIGLIILKAKAIINHDLLKKIIVYIENYFYSIWKSMRVYNWFKNFSTNDS